MKKSSSKTFPVFDPTPEVQSSLSLLQDFHNPCEKQVLSYKFDFYNPHFGKYIAWS